MTDDSNTYRTPTNEMLLLDLLQRLSKFRAGRIVVHLHFSELSSAFRHEPYIRIATESFTAFVNVFEGHLIQLENKDVFFLAKDATVTALDAAVDRVRLLFSQDPLLETYTIKGESRFCTFYDLSKDYDELTQVAQTIYQEALQRMSYRGASKPPELNPIHPSILSRLEHSLETVDVTNIARRQTICTLIDNVNPQPLFEEIYISIGDLQNIVAPGINLGSDPWLFRYLTQKLDHRIMLMLIRDGVTSTRPFSLNLNVSTILTPEFAKFESIITSQLRGRLVIEMNKLDVFSDMGAFQFARDYLHDHGFRLCLDGLTHHTLPHYDRSKLGFDLIKLNWTPNALDDMMPSMFPEVHRLILETGQAHTILCRCDDEHAINTGRDLGIVMFQGRHVDKLLTAARISVPSRF